MQIVIDAMRAHEFYKIGIVKITTYIALVRVLSEYGIKKDKCLHHARLLNGRYEKQVNG